MRTFIKIFFLILLSPSLAFALTGQVAAVKDGDTVVINPGNGSFFVCRLYGIDAPEIAHGKKEAQAYGEEAKAKLKRLVLGQVVDVKLTGSKTYNREVCIITRDGLNVNLEMVRRGYAWAYKRFLKRPYASEYIDAEKEARGRRLGLWFNYNPIPPWEFRKKHAP